MQDFRVLSLGGILIFACSVLGGHDVVIFERFMARFVVKNKLSKRHKLQ